MSLQQLVLSSDNTEEGINSIFTDSVILTHIATITITPIEPTVSKRHRKTFSNFQSRLTDSS